MVPESEEYGISSFVYHSRKPFVPMKIYDLMLENFLVQQRADGDEYDEEKDSQSWKIF